MRMAEPTRKPALFCGWMLDAGLRYRNLVLGFQPSKRRPFPIKTGVIKGFQEHSTSSCEAVFIGYPRDVYGKEIFMPPIEHRVPFLGISCPSPSCRTFINHLSNEKNPGWLGYIGDDTTQLYRDYNKPL